MKIQIVGGNFGFNQKKSSIVRMLADALEIKTVFNGKTFEELKNYFTYNEII